MPLPNYNLIIFDLDGTLSESKMPLDREMAQLFIELLAKKKIAVISGGGWEQFESQFLRSLPPVSENFTGLYLLPTSGTRLYAWRGTWSEQYAERLTAAEKETILVALSAALKATRFSNPQKSYGPLVEDRGSQITFSALGQSAPIELKSKWDPDQSKRKLIVSKLAPKIPKFDVRMGGATSIDITRRGVNKAYGIRKLEEFLKIKSDEIVFVGDALFHGGNDYPARATGVDCVEVKGPEETKQLIREWLA